MARMNRMNINILGKALMFLLSSHYFKFKDPFRIRIVILAILFKNSIFLPYCGKNVKQGKGTKIEFDSGPFSALTG